MASKQDTDYILGAIHKLRNASRREDTFLIQVFL